MLLIVLFNLPRPISESPEAHTTVLLTLQYLILRSVQSILQVSDLREREFLVLALDFSVSIKLRRRTG